MRDDKFWSQPWLHRALLYISLLALLAFAYSSGAAILRDGNIAKEWHSVRGTVVAARPEVCGKTGYIVRAHYHYSIGGVDYAGDERAAGTGNCGKLNEIQQQAKESVGAPVDIYVNPSDLGESVLGRPQITRIRYVALALSFLLIIGTILALRGRFTATPTVAMESGSR